jgi:hypothetical protein
MEFLGSSYIKMFPASYGTLRVTAMLRSASLDSTLSQINPIHILASHLGQDDLQKHSYSRITMEKTRQDKLYGGRW